MAPREEESNEQPLLMEEEEERMADTAAPDDEKEGTSPPIGSQENGSWTELMGPDLQLKVSHVERVWHTTMCSNDYVCVCVCESVLMM